MDRRSATEHPIVVLVGLLASLAVIVGTVNAVWPCALSWSCGQPESGEAADEVEEDVDVLAAVDALVYGEDAEDAADRLEEADLDVSRRSAGCSYSVAPGGLRRVTLGGVLNQRILFGKADDVIDEAARESLEAGDRVTVWWVERWC